MDTQAALAEIEEPVEIAATWGDLFFCGPRDALDWLTMRTCTVDLGGTASQAQPLDRRGLCSYASSFHRAFDDVAWRVGRIEQREHEVHLDASLEARHTGPLDLSFRGGPTFEATGRRLRLPLQRLAWTIAHKRVLGFEVERGPGLGMDLLARELELTGTVDASTQPASSRRSNGDVDRFPTPKTEGAQARKPRIEELIGHAETRLEGKRPDAPTKPSNGTEA